ncbi:uncharacterized protein CCOS01_06937, partial [Colletotrichum costaricense]
PLPVLGGRPRHFLEDETDLVSLKVSAEADFLSKRLRASWPGQDELSRDGLHRIRRYNEKSITVAVGLICIALAATLLIGTIVGFSYVCLTTNAKRGEIFAGTAA